MFIQQIMVKPRRIKTWKKLHENCKVLKTEGTIELFVPMNFYGLKGTKVITSQEDEFYYVLKIYEENKNSKVGTIILIG